MILPLPCSHSLMSHTQCHINLDHNHYRQHNDNMFLECDVCGFFKSTNPLHEPTTTTPTQNSYLKVGDAFGMLNFTSVESSSMSTELASKQELEISLRRSLWVGVTARSKLEIQQIEDRVSGKAKTYTRILDAIGILLGNLNKISSIYTSGE